MDTVYIPQEDSFLLAGVVKRYAKGKTLDIGCGSGIQGMTALQGKSDDVTFADINPQAIIYVKRQIAEGKEEKTSEEKRKNARTAFIVSDLFRDIADSYDTIIFNPPYLPEDELDDERLITTGGKKGHEIIERFLKDAKSHMNIDGQILLLFSSLTGKGAIDKIISDLGYSKNLIAKEGLFMEQLFVYQLKSRDPNIIKGHRGIVEIKGKIAIKRSLTDHYDASNEARFLKVLNKHGIGPKYISHSRDALKMEYIDGERILDYLKNATPEKTRAVIQAILDQLYVMDKLKINKLEMTNPYKHIIIRKDKPIMIDFERCIHTQKPKNVTQFIQFLCSGKIKRLSPVAIGKLRLIASNYKRNPQKKHLHEIILIFLSE